jgi:hypothetical protein
MGDIEPGQSVSSTYLQQWHDTFSTAPNAAYGYRPGFYFDATPSNSQFSSGAFCAAPVSIRNSVLWSARPKVNSTSKAAAPAFAPVPVKCGGVNQPTTAWQYTIGQSLPPPNGPVDEDEWQQLSSTLLWS